MNHQSDYFTYCPLFWFKCPMFKFIEIYCRSDEVEKNANQKLYVLLECSHIAPPQMSHIRNIDSSPHCGAALGFLPPKHDSRCKKDRRSRWTSEN